MSARWAAVRPALGEARRLFRAFRQTRPFWGGLWTVAAGLWIIQIMRFPFAVALNGGWDYSAGYVLGGALVLFGLTVWVAPRYKGIVGVCAFLCAIVAFPAANLGGFLLGSLLGVFGSALILSWGEKKPKQERGRRRRGRRPDAADVLNAQEVAS